MFDWDDLRYFLAVASHGSTLAAGRAMRVSQTTVARRIAALEHGVALPLFDRHQAGYRLTPAGAELLQLALEVEASAARFEDAALARSRDRGGIVRLTTEEVFATTLLAPMLRELRESHPEIHIDLDTSQSVRDLGAGEADIAIRGTSLAQPAGTVGRRLCRDDWTLYCSREYGERHGVPRSIAELRRHPLIGGGGGNLWREYQSWLRQLGLEDQVAMHHGTSSGLLSAVRSGIGLAVLPCIAADADPELVRCLPPRSDNQRDFWILTHERVRRTPHIRLAMDFLYDRLSAHVRALEERRSAAPA